MTTARIQPLHSAGRELQTTILNWQTKLIPSTQTYRPLTGGNSRACSREMLLKIVILKWLITLQSTVDDIDKNAQLKSAPILCNSKRNDRQENNYFDPIQFVTARAISLIAVKANTYLAPELPTLAIAAWKTGHTTIHHYYSFSTALCT